MTAGTFGVWSALIALLLLPVGEAWASVLVREPRSNEIAGRGHARIVPPTLLERSPVDLEERQAGCDVICPADICCPNGYYCVFVSGTWACCLNGQVCSGLGGCVDSSWVSCGSYCCYPGQSCGPNKSCTDGPSSSSSSAGFSSDGPFSVSSTISDVFGGGTTSDVPIPISTTSRGSSEGGSGGGTGGDSGGSSGGGSNSGGSDGGGSSSGGNSGSSGSSSQGHKGVDANHKVAFGGLLLAISALFVA